MKERKFEKSYVVDDFGNTHDSIKDTVSGLTVCTDVDEDYESFILCLPEMYKKLEEVKKGYQNLIEFNYAPFRLHDEIGKTIDEIEELLAKARGEPKDQ